jgi:hypothetical protein
MLYSFDGINWSSATAPFNYNVYSVAWNGFIWVAGGNQGTADPFFVTAYSYNGINWALGDLSIESVKSVTWNGSIWIAGGGELAYSYNGINWFSLGNTVFPAGTNVQGVVSRNVLPYVGSSPIPFTRMSTIAYGTGAGGVGQGSVCVAIGNGAGQSNQQANAIAIGQFAGGNTQGTRSVAIGSLAAVNNQGIYSVAIGSQTVATGAQTVVIGYNAGAASINSVSIGVGAGQSNQSGNSVAVGNSAGTLFQGVFGTAIGAFAGTSTQGAFGVAMGYLAGSGAQGSNAVAVGGFAGQDNQGSNAVAIGYAAGSNNQSTNTIIINATGVALNAQVPNSLYIAPIRQDDTITSNVLLYNTVTNEVAYNTTKTFVINHPKDESKYLVHACLEGPEAGVYYRGTGTIADLESSVVVELPDYVDVLATDLTVQVTPIYNGAVRVLNASCVSNNKFTVYGDSGDFWWHVYGRRAAVVVEPKKSDVVVHGTGPYRWIA